MIRADQTPPYDAEAEKALLSALFRGAATAADVLAAVADDHLYLDAHRRILASARGLADAGTTIDTRTVMTDLRRRGWLEDVGGPAYLADVDDADPTGVSWEYNAGIVREYAGKRTIIRAAIEALRDATTGVVPATEIVANLERALLATADTAARSGPVWMHAAVAESVSRIGERQAGTGTGALIPTGLATLDGIIGGLAPGKLYVVAARPSVGKTSIALRIIQHAAESGTTGLIYSLEMTAADIADRYLAMTCDVPLGEIVGSTSLGHQSVRRLAAATAHRPRILIDAAPGHTMATISSATRRAVLRHGVRLVAIDYLGLVEPPRDGRRAERRDLEIGRMVSAAKRLAKECQVPILLLAQLNREVERRNDHRPTLADLRDSGEIEQHADTVILLQPHQFRPGETDQEVTAIVAKNRQGPRGDAVLRYRRPFTRFESTIPI